MGLIDWRCFSSFFLLVLHWFFFCCVILCYILYSHFAFMIGFYVFQFFFLKSSDHMRFLLRMFQFCDISHHYLEVVLRLQYLR